MSTAYVKHMPMATTIRQDPTRPACLLMLIAAISHGAQKNHGGGTLGTWSVAPCKRCWWSELLMTWMVSLIWGSKTTNWVISTYMVGNYSKLGSSSHIPEHAKLNTNDLDGARIYISRSLMQRFSNANQ